MARTSICWISSGGWAAYRAANQALVQTLQSYGAKFETAEQAGLPFKLVHDNWHDIGPHVGFAYRGLDGRKSFVLRGGFSTNYNLIPIYGWNDRMRLNAPFAGFYQAYQLTDAAQSPDGIGNYGLVSVPPIIAGKNSADAVTFSKPQGILPGTESFQNAYFADHQPSSRVHDCEEVAPRPVAHDRRRATEDLVQREEECRPPARSRVK